MDWWIDDDGEGACDHFRTILKEQSLFQYWVQGPRGHFFQSTLMGFHPFAGDEAPMAAVNSGRGILENPFMAGKSQFEAVCVWGVKDAWIAGWW